MKIDEVTAFLAKAGLHANEVVSFDCNVERLEALCIVRNADGRRTRDENGDVVMETRTVMFE